MSFIFTGVRKLALARLRAPVEYLILLYFYTLANCPDRILQVIDVKKGCFLFLAWKGGFPLSRNYTYAHAREFNWLCVCKIKYSKCMDGLRRVEKVECGLTLSADIRGPCFALFYY